MKKQAVKQRSQKRIYTAPAAVRVTPLGACVAEKHAVQEKHFKQTRGSLAAYSKLLTRKYNAMAKAREAKVGVPEGFVAPKGGRP